MANRKMLRDYPDVLKDWDYDLNYGVDPLKLAAQSNKIFYWKCDKDSRHPSYKCSVAKRTVRLFGCPVCSSHQIIAGINDFESNQPELMKEWLWEKNNELGINPGAIGQKSSTNVWWKCKKCGGEWYASPSNRVRIHSGCPYCANLKVKVGYNDLKTLKPDLAKQWNYEKNNGLKPEDVVANYSKKIWWKCDKCGGSWQSTPNQRNKTGCPHCANRKVLVGYNDFATTCPKEASEWDYEKNGKLLPTDFTKGSETRAWFKCEKGHSWRVRIAERGRGNGCPYCANQKILIGYNDLNTLKPELVKEWDFDKNVGISPEQYTYGTTKRVWWKCNDCGHSWLASINSRAKGGGCPKCAVAKITKGRLITMTEKNGLVEKYPEVAKEWDYEKNSIDINLVPASSNRYAWWKCEKGHSYKTRVVTRTLRGAGCPYCHNQKVLRGINDLKTLNPLLSEEWDYEKNYPLTPSDVFSHSTKSVWWKCPICGHSWKAKVNNRANGRGCSNCSLSGTSFVEQAIYYYIKKVYNDALNRTKHNGKYEFDIYIPSHNIAIEYDGSFYHTGLGSDERENKKEKYCVNNGITLIRLREEPLPKTDNAINIACDCKSWKGIEKTIRDLFDYLKSDSIPDISIRRDLTDIITSKRQLLKNKSIVAEFPEVAAEWDYEKNFPLIPEYFTKGSKESVW